MIGRLPVAGRYGVRPMRCARSYAEYRCYVAGFATACQDQEGAYGGGPMADTGFPRADVENDFLRARRRQFLAMLARRLRGRSADDSRLVLLDDVVGSLGWR